MTVHCKKCDGKAFKDISSLRKHQWEVHTETFDNLRKAAQQIDRKKVWKKSRVQRELVHVVPTPNGVFTARQLLAELQGQQKFLNDVVSLISGVITQHEANK